MKIKDLRPASYNPRTITDKQLGTAKDRLTVPILPFSEIERRGAGMYKGIKRSKQAMESDQDSQRQGSTDPDAPIIKGGE